MAPSRFFAVNLRAILVWAPAHILPGVLAVSALSWINRVGVRSRLMRGS